LQFKKPLKTINALFSLLNFQISLKTSFHMSYHKPTNFSKLTLPIELVYTNLIL